MSSSKPNNQGTKLRCPICGVKRNNKHELFSSLRAVSLHIAARARCHPPDIHTSWVLNLVGNGMSMSQEDLATMLQWHIHQQIESNPPEEKRRRIGFKKT